MSTVVMSRITTQFRDLLLCDEILLHILCRVLERKTIDGATSSRALQTVAKDPVFELVEGKLLTFPLSTVSLQEQAQRYRLPTRRDGNVFHRQMESTQCTLQKRPRRSRPMDTGNITRQERNSNNCVHCIQSMRKPKRS